MTKRVDFDQYTADYNQLLQQQTAFFSASEAYFADYKVKLVKARVDQGVQRILEYGCGIGRNIPYLRAAFPDAEIVGTDISVASLELARQEQPEATFVAEHEHTTAFGSYDLIFVAGVFHHIPPEQRAAAANTLFARLNSSGKLFVFEHNPYNPVTRHIVSNCPYDEDAILLKPAELRSHLLKAGFSAARGEYCLFVPPRLRLLRWIEPWLGWLPLGGQYFVEAGK
jgi:trans-aconitate methyltransferase